MNYYDNLPFRIYVADASEKSLANTTLGKIEYTHMPNSSVPERLQYFAQKVTTKFILLSPDDDYFFPQGLQTCISFLDNNPEYSSVQGLRIRLMNKPKFRWIPDYVEQSQLHFSQSDKLSRLRLMATQMHYIYSVMDCRAYSKVVSQLNGTETNERNGFARTELVFNYVLPVLGQHKVLPVLYSARTAHPFEGGDIDFFKWLSDNKDNSAQTFMNNIKALYQSELNCTEDVALGLVYEISQDLASRKTLKNRRHIFNSFMKLPIKQLIENSFMRFFYPLSKLSYIRFFLLVFINKNTTQFVKDFNYLVNFLHSQHTRQ